MAKSTHMLSKRFSQANVGNTLNGPNWAGWYLFSDDGDIEIDNDGDYGAGGPRAMIDLSNGLSLRLGRQMPQMATYKVNYLRLDIVNVDDEIDNSVGGGAEFSGVFKFYSPTKHRIDALQLARVAEKAKEKTEIDADSFGLSTDTDYSGFRFNFHEGGTGTYDHVRHPTTSSFTNVPSGVNNAWSMQSIFDIYEMSHKNYGGQTNVLWDNRTGQASEAGWSCDYHNDGAGLENSPGSTCYEVYFDKPIEVLGGLLQLHVLNSSVDSNELWDSDWNFRVTIGVEGWEGF